MGDGVSFEQAGNRPEDAPANDLPDPAEEKRTDMPTADGQGTTDQVSETPLAEDAEPVQQHEVERETTTVTEEHSKTADASPVSESPETD